MLSVRRQRSVSTRLEVYVCASKKLGGGVGCAVCLRERQVQGEGAPQFALLRHSQRECLLHRAGPTYFCACCVHLLPWSQGVLMAWTGGAFGASHSGFSRLLPLLGLKRLCFYLSVIVTQIQNLPQSLSLSELLFIQSSFFPHTGLLRGARN